MLGVGGENAVEDLEGELIITFLKEMAAEAKLQREIAGIFLNFRLEFEKIAKPDDAAPIVVGINQATELEVGGVAEAVVGDVVGVVGDRMGEIRDGILEFLLNEGKLSAIAVGVGVAGVELDGSVEIGAGEFVVSGAPVGEAAIVEVVSVLRRSDYGDLEAVDGGEEFARGQLHQAEVVGGFDMGRVVLESLFKIGAGGFLRALHQVEEASGVEGVGIARREFDDFSQIGKSFGALLDLSVETAPEGIGAGIGRMFRDVIGEEVESLGGLTSEDEGRDARQFVGDSLGFGNGRLGGSRYGSGLGGIRSGGGFIGCDGGFRRRSGGISTTAEGDE